VKSVHQTGEISSPEVVKSVHHIKIQEKQKRDSEKARTIKTEKTNDDEWYQGLLSNPEYNGIDITCEWDLCQQWCAKNRAVFSRRRFLNWLSKCDRPITLEKTRDQKPAPVPYTAPYHRPERGYDYPIQPIPLSPVEEKWVHKLRD
jgi:hypothetical protein